MFKRLSIGQGIILGTMSVIIVALILANGIYYFFFNNTTSEIVETSSREINKQVILNFERYIDQVIQTANYLELYTQEYSEVEDFDTLNTLYSQAAQMSQDIDAIVLLDVTGEAVVNSSNQTVSPTLYQSTWFVSALMDTDIFHFSAPQIQEVYLDSETEVITVSKSITYTKDGNDRQGILVIDLNTQNLNSLSEQTNLGEGGHIIILSDNNRLVFSSSPDCTTTECQGVDMVQTLILGGDFVSFDTMDMYLNVNTLKNTRWRIATFINVDELAQSRREMNLILLGLLVSSLGISFVVAITISKRISNPISSLEQHMLTVTEGDLSTATVINGQKEIVSLNHSFNHMVTQINRLMKNLVDEQTLKRKSEFRALQAQINPHFLYNTLDSIVWLAEQNRNEDVIEMVIALSRFFRIGISKGQTLISVKEELEHAENYLLIQKVRYNKSFDYAIKSDDDVLGYPIVKLILQPLIENAIYHGIDSESDTGFITIRAYKEASYLKLSVKNNGYGITKETLAQMLHKMKSDDKATSIGLRNVYQRIKLLYDENADILIESDEESYTTVSIIVPIKEGGNLE